MNLSFDSVSDCMPSQFLGLQKRPKLIHSVGVSAKAQWIVKDNSFKYTGVFASGVLKRAHLSFSCLYQGAHHCSPFRRCSAHARWTDQYRSRHLREISPQQSSFWQHCGSRTPSCIQVKSYFQWTLAGQKGWNFFQHDLTNHVPAFNTSLVPTALSLLLNHFKSASKFPFMGNDSSESLFITASWSV